MRRPSANEFAACQFCGRTRRINQARPTPSICASCRQYAEVLTPGDWVEQAICSTTDPEIFFNDHNQYGYNKAIQVCSSCPVAAECLDYAIDADIRDGIWGGLTPAQRRELTRAH